MTAVDEVQDPSADLDAATSAPVAHDPTPPDGDEGGPWHEHPVLRTAVRWTVVAGSTVAIFSAFLVAKGADPASVLESMWDTALGTPDSAAETLIRTTPLLLAALAAAVPARAGLFNLGGQGQLIMGAIGGFLVAERLEGALSTPLTLLFMAIGGALLGAAWAAIPALLKVVTRTNEAISSLLLNYIASLVISWLCFEPWKDPTSLGQAYSRELEGPERFPVIYGDRFHIGIVVALVAAVGLWLVLRTTTWGFKLKVLGGNPSAARRAGLAVGGLSVAAMTVGGAFAGLGGMIEVAGTEGRLRPDLLAGIGFIGFLASWLARHDPLKAIAASFVLGAIAVGGSGLKITSGLSGGAVNILMALVLLAVLGWGTRPDEARS